MQIGMIGLGRTGANMVLRLLRGGHHCVVYDANSDTVTELAKSGAIGTASFADLVEKLEPPRTVWLMLPAATVGDALQTLAAKCREATFLRCPGRPFAPLSVNLIDFKIRSGAAKERIGQFWRKFTSGQQ